MPPFSTVTLLPLGGMPLKLHMTPANVLPCISVGHEMVAIAASAFKVRMVDTVALRVKRLILDGRKVLLFRISIYVFFLMLSGGQAGVACL